MWYAVCIIVANCLYKHSVHIVISDQWLYFHIYRPQLVKIFNTILIISAEDLPLAPGFTTTTTGYDPPSFYTSSGDTGGQAGSRLYGDSYRDQEIYTGPGDSYRGQGTYSLYPGNTGLSVDLPSPDSGIGPDQVSGEYL